MVEEPTDSSSTILDLLKSPKKLIGAIVVSALLGGGGLVKSFTGDASLNAELTRQVQELEDQLDEMQLRLIGFFTAADRALVTRIENLPIGE